ncbi:MAG: hypothetical protein KJ799_10185, partial [Bacteroidetes bacterium]|nr:hypothetical protein [Bacteroidota bacterium]
MATVCHAKQNNDSRVYYFDRTEYLKRKRLTSINKIPLERQKLRNPAMRESDSKRIQTEDAQWETKSKELF